MKEVIHFNDDFFYLYELIKTISTASELSLSSSVYRNKIIEEIKFIDSTLDSLYDILKSRLKSKNATSNLRSLLKTKSFFKETLSKIDQSTSFLSPSKEEESENDSTFFEFIKFCIEQQDLKIDEIIDLLNSRGDEDGPSIFITDDEMSLLLADEEESL